MLEYEANSLGNIGIKNTEINTHKNIINTIKVLKETKKLLDITQNSFFNLIAPENIFNLF